MQMNRNEKRKLKRKFDKVFEVISTNSPNVDDFLNDESSCIPHSNILSEEIQCVNNDINDVAYCDNGKSTDSSHLNLHENVSCPEIAKINSDSLSNDVLENEDMHVSSLPMNMSEIMKAGLLDLPSGKQEFLNALRNWAVRSNVSQEHLTELLRLLNQFFPDTNLPKTAVAFLGRNSTVNFGRISDNMHYFGIQNTIEQSLSNTSAMELSLDFNFDGISFFKSSSYQCWPILCFVKELCSYPFLIGAYYGREKPSVQEYVTPFVNDVQNIMENGICVSSKKFVIQSIRIICDAPARSLIKGTKYQSGYHSCDRCPIEGEYCYQHRCVTFTEKTDVKRTDAAFRTFDENNQKEVTPLIQIEKLDLINDFPIDSMHCIYLGVVKRMIKFWISGKSYKVRLSNNTISGMSLCIKQISPYMPSEFARRPRGFEELAYWKAVEYRMFLLYTGIVVLRNQQVPPRLYEHFILLHVAVTLLCLPDCKEHVQAAHDILETFVEEAFHLYGQQFLVYNVHSLLHLAEDCDRHGPLDAHSAFRFENYLQILKNRIRSGNKVTEQLFNRSQDLKNISNMTENRSVQFSTSIRDRCIIFTDMTIGFIEEVLEDGYMIREFNEVCDVYSKPVLSSSMGTFKVKKLSNSLVKMDASQILSKACALPFDDGYFVIPLQMVL